MGSGRFLFLAILLVFSIAICPSHLLASTPPFAVAATNVTMPASGNGQTSVTVSGIPMTGTLGVSCTYSGPTTTARIPTCTYGPLFVVPVNAGDSWSETISFYPWGVAVPAGMRKPARAPWAGLALGCLAAVGFGLRRRSSAWLATLLLGAVGLAGLAAITACSGGFNNMTPGSYQYTVTAANEASGSTPLGQATSTTITVIVP